MKRKQWSHVLNSAFATELIKAVPSNIYCAWVLKVPTINIAYKRSTIPGAVRGGRYFLTAKTKALFKPILNELKVKYDVADPVEKQSVKPRNQQLAQITVIINNNSVELTDGDIIEIRDNKLYLLKSL